MRVGLLGGSFNPPHIGHLRLAIEVREALSLDRVDFIPCSVPPHKKAEGLLPFAMRAEMLEEAVKGRPGLAVNCLEGRRSGPSYTFDTLSLLRAEEPETEFFFILGREDFFFLSEWHKGMLLPSLCSFAVIPRGDPDPQSFFDAARSFWSGLIFGENGGLWSAVTQWGTMLVFMPLPRLDISASFLRARWLAKRDTSFITPEGVTLILDRSRREIEDIWR